MYAPTEDSGSFQQISRADLRFHPAPAREGRVSRFNGLIRQFRSGARCRADYLCWTSRIDRNDFLIGGYSLAANDQRVFPAKLALNVFERRKHLLPRLGLGKIYI